MMFLNLADLDETVADLVTAEDFLHGNPKVSIILLAEIFMLKHGLKAPTEERRATLLPT